MLAYVIPLTYPQDSEDTTTFGEYEDPMSEEYGWASYLANGGERTAYNPGPAPDTLDNVLWTRSGVSSGMIAMDGKLIFASGSTTIYIVDPNTGTVLNTISHSGSIGSTFSFSLLFQAGPKEFFVCGGGMFGGSGVTMYNTDGQRLWSDNTISPNAVYHPALMAYYPEDGITMLYGPVASSNSIARQNFPDNINNYVEVGWNFSDPATDKGQGNRFAWAALMDWGGNPQLCYGDGKVYMGENSGWGVNALNATTGELCWRTSLKDANGYAATYGDGVLFVHCQSVHCTAINTTDGSVIWQNSEGLGRRAYAVWNGCYAYGRVYWHDLGAGLTGQTTCFDAETGEKLWGSLTVSWIGYYQICVADGKVFGQMSDGSTTTGRDPPPTAFACWDAFTGEQLWLLERRSVTAPVVAYGNLYLVASNTLTCYGPSDAPTPDPIEPEPEVEPVNWAMWRGNTENPGVAVSQPAPMLLDAGPIWTYKMDGGASSSPAVADGKVFIGSTDYNVYCLNVTTGEKIWNYTVGKRVYSSPAYANGRVYTGADNGKFLCLDAETGELLHSADDGDGSYISFMIGLGQMKIYSSPIIYDNKVYVGGASGFFYCFDLDLSPVWNYSTGQYIAGSAAVEDGSVYIFSTNNYLHKFDAQTGTLQFRTLVDNSYRSGMFVMPIPWATTPVVDGDSVYCGCATGYLAAVNSADGSPRWDNGPYFTTSEASHSSLTYYEGNLYAPCGPMTVGADADDGTELWNAWGSWEIFCSTIVVPDEVTGLTVVYIGSEAGSMTCLDAATGEAISWYTTGGNVQSTPAMYGGKLIFGSADNNVYCFEDPVYVEDTSPTMSVSLSSDTVYVDDSVDIMAQLRPGIPTMDLRATLIKPDGETVIDLDAVSSDIKGKATLNYTIDEPGNWSVMTWWAGTDNWQGVAYPAAYSEQVLLTALITPETLVASVSPEAVSVNPSEPATLTASATGGTPDYTYQWYSTYGGIGTPIPGYTSNTLTVTLTDPNVYGYYCEVTDSAGEVDSSDTAEVTVVGGGGMSMELVFIVVGVIAVAVIAVVAYMYLKKRK